MIRTFWMMMLLVTAVGLTAFNTGCQQSTREDVDDDEVGPESSGPYGRDLIEVTDLISDQIEKQRIAEDFRRDNGDAPIIAVITPQNDTRFPEVTQIFVEDLLIELMDRFNRKELRFSQRDYDVQEEVEREKAEKESGERTDRTGRKTKLGADLFLKAKFSTLSMTDGEVEDDTILYSFELIDAETDELIFKGGHKIRRVSEKSAVYR